MSTATAATTAISTAELRARIGGPDAPLVFDVCRSPAYASSERVIAGARWRDHALADQWGPALGVAAEVVVSCVHGHNVSQLAAAMLRSVGVRARYLEGGTEGFIATGGPSVRRRTRPHAPDSGPSRWVTGERPKVGGLACAWFIRRFLDPEAEIFHVEAPWVEDVAAELGAESFDVEGATLGHRGDGGSFDAFLEHYGVDDNHLRHLARVARGADTRRLDLEPECAGVLALSLGVSQLHDDDRVAMAHGIALFDALYARVRQAPRASRERSPTGASA